MQKRITRLLPNFYFRSNNIKQHLARIGIRKMKKKRIMTSQYPQISLVIPVYNTERFLEKCFRSAIAQDYPNLEILILNNGSTDNSQSIIDKYAKLDSRIVTYKIDHVQTVKESKDNCYYRAKGEWITTLDSDDTIESSFVRKLWEKSEEKNTDLVVATMVGVDLNDNQLDRLPHKGFDYNQTMTGKEAMLKTIKSWQFGMNGALIKKKIFKNIYIENEECLLYTDEVDSRLFLKEAERIAFSPAEYYHTHNPVSTGQKSSWNKYKYKLQTRLGLLRIVNSDFGVKSSEYGSLIWQSLGLSLLTCIFFFKNKRLVKDVDKLEFKRVERDLLKEIDLKRLKLSTILYVPLKYLVKILVNVI